MTLEQRIARLKLELKDLEAQASKVTRIKAVEQAEIVYYLEIKGEVTQEKIQSAFAELAHRDSDEIITKNVIFVMPK